MAASKPAEQVKAWPDPPPLLFRYTSLAWLEDIVKRSELFVPKPSSFNDPFDCRIFPDFAATPEEYRKHYALVLKDQPGSNRAERRRELKRLRSVMDRSLYEEAFHKLLDDVADTKGILCLSEIRNDILMWSHYADCHRGVCLMFDTRHEFFRPAWPVEYADEYPRVDFAGFTRMMGKMGAIGVAAEDAQREMIRTFFLTKSNHWCYESEWRVAKMTFGPYRMPPESLTGVIFGARVTPKRIEAAKLWIRQSPCKPTLLKAEVSQRAFSLEIRPLS